MNKKLEENNEIHLNDEKKKRSDLDSKCCWF